MQMSKILKYIFFVAIALFISFEDTPSASADKVAYLCDYSCAPSYICQRGHDKYWTDWKGGRFSSDCKGCSAGYSCVRYSDSCWSHCGEWFAYYCTNQGPISRYNPPKCTYVAWYAGWTACNNSVQYGYSPQYNTIDGSSCSDASSVRACAMTWTNYCTGAYDPNPWQIWAYDNSTPSRNYKYVGPGTAANGCVAPKCTGSVIPNADAWSSSENQYVPFDMPWAYSSSDTGRKCEFGCRPGYLYVSGACLPIPTQPSIWKSSCNSAGTVATLGISASYVDYYQTSEGVKYASDFPYGLSVTPGVTKGFSARACNYQTGCGSWAYLDVWCPKPVCTNPISHASLCPTDEDNLPGNTPAVAVDNCTIPAAATKCEFDCNNYYHRTSNTTCGDNLCTNSSGINTLNASLCPNDGISVPVHDTPYTLGEYNTCSVAANPKCEYNCNRYYHIDTDGKSCKPYICTGSSKVGAVFCNNDDIEMDVDTPKSLITSSAACSATKCEMYCTGNYFYQNGNCEPFKCGGSIPAGGAPCPNSGDNMTAHKDWTYVSSCTAGAKCEYTDAKGSAKGWTEVKPR